MSTPAKTEAQLEEFLIFELAGQRYALLSKQVREILRAATPTQLPNAPALVEGILNVRGEVIALLDIRRRLAVPAKPISASDHLIVASDGERFLALRVDRVLYLQRIDVESVVSASRYLTKTQADSHAIGGAFVAQDGLVLIQDLGHFLSVAEKQALQRSLAPVLAEQPGTSPEAGPGGR